MKYTQILASLLIASPCFQAFSEDANSTDENTTQLDTVKVSADFRQLDLQQIPSSITVVNQDSIEKRNADHLESILSVAPNVNFSSGASRGRYIQIRGIGERSQFVDPVSSSVGLIVDGIDMTGLAGAATLFDIEQVEILRGPQGTAFGANALAGAINIKSTEQREDSSGYISAKAGNYNAKNINGAYGKKINENVSARFAIQSNTSDGYIENDFLNRDDTSNFDEQSFKTNIKWEDHLNSYKLNLINIKTDNGYDIFTINNTRTTQSDEPGKDTINLTGASIQTSNTNPAFTIETNTEFSISDTAYSYDYDWMHVGYRTHSDTDFEVFNRDTNKGSIDIRLLSSPESNLFSNTTSWVFGAYIKDFSEDLKQTRTENSVTSNKSNSINSLSTAVYGEFKSNLSSSTSLIYGLRIENWNSDFSTSESLDETHSETLYGGKLAIESLIHQNHLAYASLSRGYKAGGFNSNSDVPDNLVKFDTEYNWSTEIGLKSSLLNDSLTTNIAAFYIIREDQQLKNSKVLDNGTTFLDAINNAASGKNYGVELESQLVISKHINWNASIGLLKTEINGFSINVDTDGDWIYDATEDKSGRSQSHAPEYTFSTSLDFNLSDRLQAQIEVEGKDSFYFSDSHDAQSVSYELINASISYALNDWKLSLVGKNLADEEVETRGFSGWIQDPLEVYNPGKYTQFGEPRLISLSARYDF